MGEQECSGLTSLGVSNLGSARFEAAQGAAEGSEFIRRDVHAVEHGDEEIGFGEVLSSAASRQVAQVRSMKSGTVSGIVTAASGQEERVQSMAAKLVPKDVLKPPAADGTICPGSVITTPSLQGEVCPEQTL